MKIIIIIPTYNERENIGALINALQAEFTNIPHNMNILVVDDNSPDKTSEIVKAEMQKYPNVFLITGKKQGLGAAYIRGMKYAVDQLNADSVMEMDADFSHKPEDVSRLISALDAGADFAIGSRYIKGGSIPATWGIMRKMISKGGNIFARYIAGLNKIKDCTAGFRAIRSSVIRNINMDNLKVQGYAFQMALLHRAIMGRAIVKEIPVNFVDRVEGKSKIGLSDIVEFMFNAWWIRLESSKTFLRFALVGVVGVLINLGAFTILMLMGVNKFIASPLAIEISIISNFFFNNYWTFASRNTNTNIHLKGIKFNIVSLIALVISYSTFLGLSIVFPNAMPQVHQAIGIIPAMGVNYFFNSYWTFKHKVDGEKEIAD